MTYFWRVHSVDTLLSLKATGKELAVAVKRHNLCQKSHDNDNMAEVVRPDIIDITHIHAVKNKFFIKCNTYSGQYASLIASMLSWPDYCDHFKLVFFPLI